MSESKSNITSIKTVGTFIKVGACSSTLCNVLNRAYEQPLINEESAAIPLAGGLMQHGYQCGMIWGSTLAAGAQAYRLHGAGPKAETRAIVAAQRVVASFRTLNNCIDCFDITEMNETSTGWQLTKHFLLKGGTIHCFSMASKYAPVVFNEINAALSENHIDTFSAPVSCAAVLAQKMGASDMHTVMASGLAGGIGLSGGGCGALGAALWITGLNSLKAGNKKIDYKAPENFALIDKFLKCTNYEFTCSKIVGRKFESVGDHAAYVCNGGCSKIIEVLAAK